MSERKCADTADLKYEPLEFVPPDYLDEYVESGDPERIRKAIYSATAHGDGLKWAQDQCLRFIKSEHASVRWAAAQSLGTLAFLKRPIEADKVLPALQEALSDPTIAGEADMSIDMVKHALSLR